jgi:mitochondrial import inner membrane translocase subunit TIM54
VAAGYDYSLHLNSRQGLTRTSVREMTLAHRLQRQSSTNMESTPLTREKEGGDVIVVGRNTFKEIIRGIHEGYLLPLDYVPPSPPEDPQKNEEKTDDKPPPPPDPILTPINPSQYSSLPDPSPSDQEYAITYIPSLHILGIRHTPKRIYRFLTRRYMADGICEQVVACILEQQKREWTDDDVRHGEDEEVYWPKTIKPEAEWREKMVIDSRIRQKLFWRQPEEVQEVYDDREASAPEDSVVRVEELRPTEEELARDQMNKAQFEGTRLIPTNPFSRK